MLRAGLDPRVRAFRDRGLRAAGVAGTAITADLGARKIREELDALQVLGGRPDQEPGRPALPLPDDPHRPAQHLRPAVRHRRRHRRDAALRSAARRVLRHAVLQRVDRPNSLSRWPRTTLFGAIIADRLLPTRA